MGSVTRNGETADAGVQAAQFFWHAAESCPRQEGTVLPFHDASDSGLKK
jgi:hypothetical protein